MKPSPITLVDVASTILASVKTAETGRTNVDSSSMTEVGGQLMKLARELRAPQPLTVTYSDIAEFRRRHAV